MILKRRSEINSGRSQLGHVVYFQISYRFRFSPSQAIYSAHGPFPCTECIGRFLMNVDMICLFVLYFNVMGTMILKRRSEINSGRSQLGHVVYFQISYRFRFSPSQAIYSAHGPFPCTECIGRFLMNVDMICLFVLYFNVIFLPAWAN